MMALTHAAIAATGASFILQTTNPLALGLAMMGSQLPDLDSSQSLIGQVCWPLSHWLEDRYPHRSVTHSLIATAAIAALSFALWFFVRDKFPVMMAIALPLGHVLSTFSDTFTKQGVQLFWPEPVWCVCGSNPRRRLKTGGVGEYWVLGGAIALLVVSLQLNGMGGLKQVATDQLGLNDPNVTATYNQNAATNHVYAAIEEGFKRSDRTPFTGRYPIIAEDGGYVIMTETGALYKVGDGIVDARLKTEVGDAATTDQTMIALDDEEVGGRLAELRSPQALTLLTGSIEIDFPEDVAIEFQPDELQALSLSGSNAILNHCPLEKAIAKLSGQWGIGQLQVKVISPSPWRENQ